MDLGLWKYLVFVFIQFIQVYGEDEIESLTGNKLVNIYLKNGIHSYNRPSQDEPTEVFVSLYILNIDLDEKQQECSLTMYFRQEWNDSRLSYKSDKKVISMPYSTGLWTPDLFFTNEKSGHLHTVTKPNLFVKIYPEGRVLYSQRVTVTLACPMDFRKYPFDTQICALPMESYGYTANELIVKWKPEITFGLTPPPGFDMYFSTIEEVVHFDTNNFSRLELDIHFPRFSSPQIIHVYIPLSLLVVASWISFYLQPSNQILRLTTIVLTTFTSVILTQSNKEFSHFTIYLTGFDVWIGFCYFLLFAVVLENIYVIAKHGQKPLTFEKEEIPTVKEANGGKDKRKLMGVLAGKLSAGDSGLDAICRMAFPSVFLLFLIVYLAYYLI